MTPRRWPGTPADWSYSRGWRSRRATRRKHPPACGWSALENPQGSPLLDRKTVSVIPGDAEQLHVPEGFGSGSGKGLLAS